MCSKCQQTGHNARSKMCPANVTATAPAADLAERSKQALLLSQQLHGQIGLSVEPAVAALSDVLEGAVVAEKPQTTQNLADVEDIGPGDGVESGQARVRIVVETGDAEEKAHADVQPQMLAADVAPTVVAVPAKSSVRDALDASVAAAVEKGFAVASTAAPNVQADSPPKAVKPREILENMLKSVGATMTQFYISPRFAYAVSDVVSALDDRRPAQCGDHTWKFFARADLAFSVDASVRVKGAQGSSHKSHGCDCTNAKPQCRRCKRTNVCAVSG